MIDDSDNFFDWHATVVFVLCANAGDGSCNKHNVSIKSHDMAVIWGAAK